MIRLFFGEFLQSDPALGWDALYANDAIFSMFGWGRKFTDTDNAITATVMPSKRQPFVTPLLDPYDEYMDLHTASVDTTPVNVFSNFANAFGVNTPFPILPASMVDGGCNDITIEANMSEWLGKTRMLSFPTPHPYNPPSIPYWVVNQTLEDDPTLTITDYISIGLRWYSVVDGESYAAEPTLVPVVDPVTDDIRVEFLVPYAAAGYVVRLYRAPVEASSTSQRFNPWDGWESWRLLDQHRRFTHLAIPAATAGMKTSVNNYADTTAFPYISRSDADVVWCDFEPLNDAIARMGLSWQKRAFRQVLILDTDTMKYYIGYLTEVSDVFYVGPSKISGDSTAQFKVSITEEGQFDITALEDPTGDYYTELVREETL